MAEPLPGDRPEDTEAIYLRQQFKLLLFRLQLLPEKVRAKIQGHFAQVLIDRTVTMQTPRGPLAFVTLGRSGAGRGMSMLTKQPFTIEWIDRFRPKGVFWDVGANVGVYSLYAALRGDTRVVAFEPAAVNFFLLAANCEANRLDAQMQCLMIGLGREKMLGCIEVSQFAAAQSFSFLGRKDHAYAGRQSALIMSMDQAIDEYGLPCPNYLKIDVPGLTPEVICGGARTLSRPELREVHIEASETSSKGRRLIETLNRHGFVVASAHNHGSTDLIFVRPHD
jgi:FkbM family methyltransferase